MLLHGIKENFLLSNSIIQNTISLASTNDCAPQCMIILSSLKKPEINMIYLNESESVAEQFRDVLRTLSNISIGELYENS